MVDGAHQCVGVPDVDQVSAQAGELLLELFPLVWVLGHTSWVWGCLHSPQERSDRLQLELAHRDHVNRYQARWHVAAKSASTAECDDSLCQFARVSEDAEVGLNRGRVESQQT